MTDIAELKRRAAARAVEQIESGMVVGLGTGSTSAYAILLLAERLREGRLTNVVGVPTSQGIEMEARRLGIPLSTLNDHPRLDLTIDGADEVDPDLNMIKGGGGALLREKIVAQASARNVIIVDESKLTAKLGTRFYVPVEVISFGWQTHVPFLEDLGTQVTVRRTNDGTPLTTDEGNLILDCHCAPLDDPIALGEQLDGRAGIVEHGLFLGLASEVIVASAAGIRHLYREEEAEKEGRRR